MEFIGQKSLFTTINNFTIQTLPHTILLLGDEGCGKKTVAKYIANKFSMDLIPITEVDQEKLIEYQQRAIKTAYLIDLSKLVYEKDQNQFLKFIEEPSNNTYVILINSSEIGILPTILNRCKKLRFEPYTVEQLKQVKPIDNELVYKVCKTPGQLSSIDSKKLDSLQELCSNIVNKLSKASYTNAISIATKLNYKEDYNKFDFTTFLNLLELTAKTAFIEQQNQIAAKIYLYLTKRRQVLLQNSKVQKEAFMINLLDGLWKEAR